MRIYTLLPALVLALGCGKADRGDLARLEQNIVDTRDAKILSVVQKMQLPAAGELRYESDTIANLNSNLPTTTSHGTVTRGTTLNYLEIEGESFLVYGEDGTFAAECEPDAAYPSHGPTHPLCSVGHAESFDRIIVCVASAPGVSIQSAQNWPGSTLAMTTSVGMRCWIDGVAQTSQKFFTY